LQNIPTHQIPLPLTKVSTQSLQGKLQIPKQKPSDNKPQPESLMHFPIVKIFLVAGSGFV
jgi:hypothetical protein